MTAENYLQAYEASSIIDAEWTEEDWYGLMRWLINAKLASWKEVTSLVLGHLNPSTSRNFHSIQEFVSVPVSAPPNDAGRL